jgi:protein subunit release factor A
MEIKPEDLIISTFNTSGSSWVSNNSGVRIYHKPTGIEVTCEDHKGQHRNRAVCQRMLEEELCYLQSKEGE